MQKSNNRGLRFDFIALSQSTVGGDSFLDPIFGSQTNTFVCDTIGIITNLVKFSFIRV